LCDFYAPCFRSYHADAEITDDEIPFVIRDLPEHRGSAGCRRAAELRR